MSATKRGINRAFMSRSGQLIEKYGFGWAGLIPFATFNDGQ
jgi:hypothetical protein